jgi:hypothetical protein
VFLQENLVLEVEREEELLTNQLQAKLEQARLGIFFPDP